MKKKTMALLLSAVFAVTSVGGALAQETPGGDWLAQEEAAEGRVAETEDCLDEANFVEALTGAAEKLPGETVENADDGSLGRQSESGTEEWMQGQEEIREESGSEMDIALANEAGDLEEDFIVGIEEVAPAEAAGVEDQEFVAEETVTEPLEESGIAEMAKLPEFSLFSNGEYLDSYGGQLEGDAQYIYGQMEQKGAELEAVYAAGGEYALPVITYTSEETYRCHLSQEERSDSELRNKNADYIEMIARMKYPMQAAYDAYVFDHPEAYWMGAPVISYSLGYDGSDGEGYTCTVSKLQIKLKENYEGFLLAIPAYKSAVQEAYQKIQDELGESTSHQDILLAIHDYLCDMLTYDHAYASYASTSKKYKYIHSAAGAFLDEEHKVVCDGYAKAFKILAEKFGIACAVIPGNAGGAHAWNYVKMEDGNWYLVDVTWDDSNDRKTYRYFLIGSQTVPSGTSRPVGEARTAYSNFSSAQYTKSFAVPVLNGEFYHAQHLWAEYEPNGDASCTEDGTKTARCQREDCSETNTIVDVGSRLGHSWTKYQSNGDAACLTDGTKTAICDREGCTATNTITDEGSRLGHSWTKYQSNGDAACLTDGTKTAVCNREGCTATNTITDKGSRLGHSWTKYKSNGDATCLADGTKTAMCDREGCTVKNTVTDAGSRLPATISLNVSSITLKVKQSTTKVTVSGLGPGDSVKSWSSSKPKVAAVNARTGRITGKKAGTARITVTLQSGKTAEITVKVQKKTVKTTKISGVGKKLSLKKNTRLRLKPVVTPITSQQKVTFCSSNRKIVTVSKNGVITGKKAGKATITVKSGSKKVKCKVTVK